MNEGQTVISPRLQWVLRFASVHCCIWGIFIALMPTQSAQLYGFEKPLTDEFLWQGTGLVIFLLGCGYGLASINPLRHYSVVAVGLMAKVLGPIGMLWSVLGGSVSENVLILIPFNDIIWWLPFGMIVTKGFRNEFAPDKSPR